jgi:hypothetical protein
MSKIVMDSVEETNGDRETRSESIAKKAYLKPVLLRLGLMHDLTQKVGYRGRSDGGRFPSAFRTAF